MENWKNTVRGFSTAGVIQIAYGISGGVGCTIVAGDVFWPNLHLIVSALTNPLPRTVTEEPPLKIP
jgi:DNA-binding transcriptional regulator YdaS (Cro superfamily)